LDAVLALARVHVAQRNATVDGLAAQLAGGVNDGFDHDDAGDNSDDETETDSGGDVEEDDDQEEETCSEQQLREAVATAVSKCREINI
jgi:hypothetical protein